VFTNNLEFSGRYAAIILFDGLINSTDALIILSCDVGLPCLPGVGEPGCPQDVTPCPGCNEEIG